MPYNRHADRSEITIRLELRDWPDVPRLGVIARDHGRLEICAEAALHEPVSSAQIRRAFDMLLTAFLTPELGEHPSEQLHDVFHALTAA